MSELLKEGAKGHAVLSLQKKLARLGYDVEPDGAYGPTTVEAVKLFQLDAGLNNDGIAGPQTWTALLSRAYDFKFNTGIDGKLVLPVDEYYQESYDKRTIFLHHTAGHFNPDGTYFSWVKDRDKNGDKIKVATAFIIGGRKPGGTNNEFDGKTYRVFEEKYWAHHLGTRLNNNVQLNRQSIGIELCNLGPLEEEGGSFFKIWRDNSGKVEKKLAIPESEVCDLGFEWKGHLYYHKYTDLQIRECKRLVLHLAALYDIPVRDFNYTPQWFGLNEQAMEGQAGVWTHANVRKDKSDCSPQPALIDMLNSLHAEFQGFKPDLVFEEMGLESFSGFSNEELRYYYEEL